jgi:hypothetical protein
MAAHSCAPTGIGGIREQDRGKHIYLLGRWEINREGGKGPFGAIEEAIIP